MKEEIYKGTIKIRATKYLGNKQVYTFQDFTQYWRAYGFVDAVKQAVKKSDKYYFQIK